MTDSTECRLCGNPSKGICDNCREWLKQRSPYRFKYQRYSTNQEIINMVNGNPSIYGNPKDKNSNAFKIFEKLEIPK